MKWPKKHNVLFSIGCFLCYFFVLYSVHHAYAATGLIQTHVRVFGPPTKPILTATTGCTQQRTSSIQLEWPEDDNAISFDVYRDDSELMTGLSDNSYVDTTVSQDISYSYHVVAIGPEGTEISDYIDIVAVACPEIANPNVLVSAMNGIGTEALGSVPKTTQKKPVFSGITNIPYAIIQLEMHSEQIIYATTTANEVGFWQWSPPVDLTSEVHTLYITAIDPLYPDDATTSSYVFEVINEDLASDTGSESTSSIDDSGGSGSSKKKKSHKKDQKIAYQGSIVSSSPAIGEGNAVESHGFSERPFDFDMSLTNTFMEDVGVKDIAYRGGNIDVAVTFTYLENEEQKTQMMYKLFSSNGELVGEYSDTAFPVKNISITKTISLWHKFELGKYKLQVSAMQGDAIISRETYFVLRDKIDNPNVFSQSAWNQYGIIGLFVSMILFFLWSSKKRAVILWIWIKKNVFKQGV